MPRKRHRRECPSRVRACVNLFVAGGVEGTGVLALFCFVAISLLLFLLSYIFCFFSLLTAREMQLTAGIESPRASVALTGIETPR